LKCFLPLFVAGFLVFTFFSLLLRFLELHDGSDVSIHSSLSLFREHLGKRQHNFWTQFSFAIFLSDALTSVFLSLHRYKTSVACRALIDGFGALLVLAEHLRIFKNQARAGTVKPASPIIESKANKHS